MVEFMYYKPWIKVILFSLVRYWVGTMVYFTIHYFFGAWMRLLVLLVLNKLIPSCHWLQLHSISSKTLVVNRSLQTSSDPVYCTKERNPLRELLHIIMWRKRCEERGYWRLYWSSQLTAQWTGLKIKLKTDFRCWMSSFIVGQSSLWSTFYLDSISHPTFIFAYRVQQMNFYRRNFLLIFMELSPFVL